MGRPSMTDERKLDILELIEKGVPQKQIAKDLHCSTSTIWQVKKEFYGGKDDMTETIIAGNKHDGLLMSISADRYSGTCRFKNGKMKKKVFQCSSSKEAIAQWEEWKQQIQSPRIPIEVTRITTTPPKEKTVSANSEAILDSTSTVYVLCIGTPNIAELFTEESEARKAMQLANKALEFSGVDVRYSVASVPINKN